MKNIIYIYDLIKHKHYLSNKKKIYFKNIQKNYIKNSLKIILKKKNLRNLKYYKKQY